MSISRPDAGCPLQTLVTTTATAAARMDCDALIRTSFTLGQQIVSNAPHFERLATLHAIIKRNGRGLPGLALARFLRVRNRRRRPRRTPTLF
jgi:hypothetical protein